MRKCSALPCHVPLIAHQTLAPSCRTLPESPKGTAQPLVMASCCEQQQGARRSYRWAYKVPSRTSSDSKSGIIVPTPGTENWSLSRTEANRAMSYPIQWVLLPSELRETKSIVIQPFYICLHKLSILFYWDSHSISKPVACSAEDP